MTLILASASPRRKQLLDQLKVPFKVVPSRVSERRPTPGESSAVYARALALEKAQDVRSRLGPGTVLAADTVVTIGPTIFGKPRDEQDALRMLTALRGRQHRVTTAVVVLCGCTDMMGDLTTIVRMRCFSDDEARRYTASGEPLDKAGAYALQESGGAFVDSIEGCYNAVVGLPLCLTSRLLRECEIDVGALSGTACARCPVSPFQ